MTRTRSPWLVVLGSALALTVGNGPVMQFTFGVFLKPVVEEFHVARGVASLALTIGLMATALFMPLAGRLADRIGPRRLGLLSVSLLSLCLIAVALLSHSIWMFMALFAVTGVAAAGQTPLPYTKAVAASFDQQRGLALALTLTGVGVGSIVLPMIAQALVMAFGWRGAYLGIALLLVAVAIPALLLFMPRGVTGVAAAPDAIELPGLTPAQAVRTRSFWLMLLGLFLGAAAANGTIAHVVPMLTDRGVPASAAVGALATVGFAAIAGRMIGGFLLDRIWAPLVSLIFFAGMAAGIALLASTPTLGAASIAVLLLGLGLGVEADLLGFLLSRYLGLRAYGALFGWVFGAFLLASSLGPLLMGALFDATGSYVFCLLLFVGFTVAAAAAFLALGRYTYPVIIASCALLTVAWQPAQAAAPSHAALRGQNWDSIKKLPDWSGMWAPGRPPAGQGIPGFGVGGRGFGSDVPLTPKYAALRDARMVRVFGKGDKGVDDIPLSNSGMCLPNGTPANMAPVSHEYVYSPGRVTILLENSEIRRIWTDGRGHVPDDLSNPSFSGDSIGHWEADTLVVETTNIYPEAEVFIGQHVTAKTIVKERIARSGNRLQIDTVVEDSELFTKPWTYTRWYDHEDRAAVDYESCTASDRAKKDDDRLLGIDFNVDRPQAGEQK